MSYQAPVAQVAPRNRNKIRETVEFQADADRREEARDREDLDWQQSKITPRKRRAPDEDPPRSAKKKSPGHQPYSGLIEDSKKERKTHLANIRRNWGNDTKKWMPESLWPGKLLRGSGNRRSRRPVIDPKDWNTPLLEELAHLSAVTKKQPAVAIRAMKQAVERRQDDEGDHDETQLLKDDIQVARALCQTADASQPTPAPTDASAAAADVEVGADVDMVDEPTHGLPTVRSPTLAGDETVVKVENQFQSMPNVMTNVTRSPRTGFDDDIDRLEELKLQRERHDAIAASKEMQLEALAVRRRMRERMRQQGQNADSAIDLGS